MSATIEQRAALALERLRTGHAPMRIPADPTDPDLVIAELLADLNGAKKELDFAKAEFQVANAQLEAALRQHEEDEEFIDSLGNVCCGVAFTSGQYEEHNERMRTTEECAYCRELGPRTPEAMTAHASRCANHPLSAALAQVAALREALDRARRYIAVECPLHYLDHQNQDGSGKSGCYVEDFKGTMAILTAADAAIAAAEVAARGADAKPAVTPEQARAALVAHNGDVAGAMLSLGFVGAATTCNACHNAIGVWRCNKCGRSSSDVAPPAVASHDVIVCDDGTKPGQRDGWVARCSCGWTSLPKATEAEADGFAFAHRHHGTGRTP